MARLGALRRSQDVGQHAVRVLLRVLYWLAVVAISLALVIALILFFESRDQSSIEGAAPSPVLTKA